MKRTVALIFLAIFFFVTWQYRLLCLLFVLRIWRNRLDNKVYSVSFYALLVGIFIAIPNYFGHGRTQLVYFDKQGSSCHAPWYIYLANVICPEEEAFDKGMKFAALFPSSDRFMREAKDVFWSRNMFCFYHPYNDLSLNWSNPGSAPIAQKWNELTGDNLECIYITRPKDYDANKKYPLVVVAHGYLGNWEMYQGVFGRLDNCFIISIGTRDLSGVFKTNDVNKVFNRYIPYLTSQGYKIDMKQMHLVGISNGTSASNLALMNKSFKTVTFMMGDCKMSCHQKAKVIGVGGAKDASSLGLPGQFKKLKAAGTPTALYFSSSSGHYVILTESDKVMGFLQKEMNLQPRL